MSDVRKSAAGRHTRHTSHTRNTPYARRALRPASVTYNLVSASSSCDSEVWVDGRDITRFSCAYSDEFMDAPVHPRIESALTWRRNRIDINVEEDDSKLQVYFKACTDDVDKSQLIKCVGNVDRAARRQEGLETALLSAPQLRAWMRDKDRHGDYGDEKYGVCNWRLKFPPRQQLAAVRDGDVGFLHDYCDEISTLLVFRNKAMYHWRLVARHVVVARSTALYLQRLAVQRACGPGGRTRMEDEARFVKDFASSSDAEAASQQD